MNVVINEFGGIPELFVPSEIIDSLRDDLNVYNIHLMRGHVFPWYRMAWAGELLLNKAEVIEFLELVAQKQAAE